MKRDFAEISDDEWDNHSFKLSRGLKKSQGAPPPIESFSYRSENPQVSPEDVSDGSSDDCVEIKENLEDDDAEVVAAPASRGRRFVVDEDSDDDYAEVVEVKSGTEEEQVEEDDVVGKALQKCAKISAELRRELYGSSVTACDRYAEVESSSVRIVTQVLFLFFIFCLISRIFLV